MNVTVQQRIFVFILLLICLVPQELVAGRKKNKSAAAAKHKSIWYSKPTLHNFSGGMTTGYQWKSGFGVQESYDVKVHPFISFGIQANIYFNENRLDQNRAAYLGGRMNFHLFYLANLEVNRTDLYMGYTAGSFMNSAKKEFSSGLYVGLRRDLFPNWSIFGEAGSGLVLGLALKL